MEFLVGDQDLLKVLSMKGVMRFGINPHYIGPIEILDGLGLVSYMLAVSPNFSGVHTVFHVSML